MNKMKYADGDSYELESLRHFISDKSISCVMFNRLSLKGRAYKIDGYKDGETVQVDGVKMLNRRCVSTDIKNGNPDWVFIQTGHKGKRLYFLVNDALLKKGQLNIYGKM
jgi:hypothetical protein